MFEISKASNAMSYRLGGLMLFATAGAIISALGFQYIGGYDPCPLCLMQRYAYYAAVPLLFIAMALASGSTMRSISLPVSTDTMVMSPNGSSK